jgi:putative drug exporter of the RND superfamily
MSSVLKRIAVFSVRHRALVILTWLVCITGLVAASHIAGTRYTGSVIAPGSDSAAAADLLGRSFSKQAADSSPIVFHTDAGTLTDAAHKSAVEASVKALSTASNVAAVTDPFNPQTPTVSRDGRTAYATVLPSKALGDLTVDKAQAILDTARDASRPAGIDVQAGGQLGSKLSKPATESSEMIGIAVAILILVLVFGTVTSMVLPIGVAISGLIGGLSIVSLFGHVASVSDVAPTVATMIGLGVGIDYSLFIVTRARSARARGMSVPDAIGYAASTSGTAVAFAGGTVVIALLSLAVSGLSLVTVLGQAAAIVVVIAVLASMTLLPALLGLCGDGIERLRVGRDRRSTLDHSRVWERWGGLLARRPHLFALGSVVLLFALASPVLHLKLGLTDQSSAPKSTTVRAAYDELSSAFGPGANGPLLVAVELGSHGATSASRQQLQKLDADLAQTPGVQVATRPTVFRDGTAAMITVIPRGSPTSDQTSDLVNTIRDHVIPASGADAHVGGSTAQLLDLADMIGKRLPLIIGIVVLLSMLLLLVAFRSLVAPVQAAFVNLLAVGAAYGIVTAVFQDGHGASSIGLDGAIPIVSFVPMMMFAILFGLSMDYQVFLLSRVREEIDAGKSPRQAVIAGMAATGKVIASAAAIMVAVFTSFIINGDPTVKEFGVGLGSAILIAGSMVCVLLPGVMLLMGRRTWWLPRWLDRTLPRISVEGEVAPSPA